jgi:hypothetical protein
MSINLPSIICNATINMDNDKLIDVNKVHEMMVHFGVEKLKKTANIHSFELTERVEVCKDCAIAKERQKSTNKKTK